MTQNISITIENKTSSTDKLLCIFTFLYFCRTSFTNFAQSFHVSTAIVAGIIILIFASSVLLFTIKSRKVSIDGIIIILSAMAFFYITLKIHPEYTARYINASHNGRFGAAAVFRYGAGIYTYYIIRLYKKKEHLLYSVFRLVPYAVAFLNIWTLFFNRKEEYKMDFGYQMEIAAILFILQYFYEEKDNIYPLIFSIVSIGAGVIYGSRACILGYVCFIAIYLFWKKKLNKQQVAILSMGIIAAIAYQSSVVMIWAYNTLLKLGIHSRTLYYIAAGDVLAVDTARQDKIWPVLKHAFDNAGLFKMYGAYGDRYLLSMRWPYSHNFFYEFMLTFGKFFGGIMLIWMIVSIIRTLRNNRNDGGVLTIAFGSFIMCKLFFSGTFWQEPYFWAFIAMLVNYQGHKTKKLDILRILKKIKINVEV